MKTDRKTRRTIDDIMAIAHGFRQSLILAVANRIGIFEITGETALDAKTIAKKLKLDPEALELLLNALTGAGWLTKRGTTYALQPHFRQFLTRKGSHYIGDILRHNYFCMTSWMNLEDIVRKGRSKHAVERERLHQSELLEAFIRGMADISRYETAEVMDVLNPGRFTLMVDLGGGPGCAAIECCRRNPDLRAIVFDHPQVVPIALEEIAAAGMNTRIAVIGGDFTLEIPVRGADFMYLSNIIHSYSLQVNEKVLRRCHKSLVSGGTIVVKDFFLDRNRTHPPANSMFALNMLVNTNGGRTFTVEEVKMMLRKTLFTSIRVNTVNARSSLITARKP